MSESDVCDGSQCAMEDWTYLWSLGRLFDLFLGTLRRHDCGVWGWKLCMRRGILSRNSSAHGFLGMVYEGVEKLSERDVVSCKQNGLSHVPLFDGTSLCALIHSHKVSEHVKETLAVSWILRPGLRSVLKGAIGQVVRAPSDCKTTISQHFATASSFDTAMLVA